MTRFGDLERLLSWCLGHCIWQAFVLLLLLELLLRFGKRWSAATRHTLGLLCLALVLIVPIATVLLSTTHPFPAIPVTLRTDRPLQLSNEANDLHHRHALLAAEAPAPSIAEAVVGNWYSRLTKWLLLVWAIASALALFFQLSRLWLLSRSLRKQSVLLPELQPKIATLSKSICVSRPIECYRCELVRAPATLGSLHPKILVPPDQLAQLPSEQQDLLYLHELAHVRRQDYLINLVQLFLESLLFFHPAVWRIGKQIRCERESSCDAMAVKVAGKPVELARALLALARSALPPPVALQGATSSPFKLRVERLLEPPPPITTWRTRLLHYGVLGIALALCIGFTAIVGGATAEFMEADEFAHSELVELVYRTIGHEGNEERALAKLLDTLKLVKTRPDHKLTDEELTDFAEVWVRDSGPHTYNRLIIPHFNAWECFWFRQAPEWPYYSSFETIRLTNQLWVSAQRQVKQNAQAAAECSRAAMLVDAQDNYSSSMGLAARLLQEPRFQAISCLNNTQISRLRRINSWASQQSAQEATLYSSITHALDRLDTEEPPLLPVERKQIIDSLRALLKRSPKHVKNIWNAARITQDLRVRFPDDHQLLADLDSLIAERNLPPKFTQWAGDLRDKPSPIPNPEGQGMAFIKKTARAKQGKFIPAE